MAFKSWKVAKEESGIKLLQFLQLKLGKEFSLKKLKHAIECNLCLLNGRTERFASTVVGLGDHVFFDVDQMVSLISIKEVLPPPILYEDEDFLFIDKPSGISSEDKKLLASLKNHLQKDLFLVHRLDKETSGVLLLAKTTAAKEAADLMFRERKVSKRYLAIVVGPVTKLSGHIENFLAKIAELEGQQLWGIVSKDKGLLAVTDWKCLKNGPHAALLECSPHTGRTHQIRVHLASIGHPILGDHLYNKLKNLPYVSKRCLLHAFELSFIHPFTKKSLKVSTAPPEDFKIALKTLLGSTCGY